MREGGHNHFLERGGGMRGTGSVINTGQGVGYRQRKVRGKGLQLYGSYEGSQ